jgi:hypothetical protein
VKIIEKVRISTYYESAETDLYIAENAGVAQARLLIA